MQGQAGESPVRKLPPPNLRPERLLLDSEAEAPAATVLQPTATVTRGPQARFHILSLSQVTQVGKERSQTGVYSEPGVCEPSNILAGL